MAIFGKNEPKPPEPVQPPRPQAPAPGTGSMPAVASRACLIGPRTVIKGEITGDEDVVVEGRVEGQVKISKELRVGQGGNVSAAVEAQSIIIAGDVTGNCTASARVEIQATGRLTGDIRAPRIVIAEGASFRGKSDMSPREAAKDKAAAS